MSVRTKLSSACSDESGSVAAIFALCAVVLLAMLGIAIDTARHENLASQLQSTLDSASLAAARALANQTMSDEEVQAVATTYFENAKASFGVQSLSTGQLKVAIDRDRGEVRVTNRMKVPTYFGGMLAMPSSTVVERESASSFNPTLIELSLVLDVSSSMGNAGRLDQMKVMAKDIIETLYAGALSDKQVRIALAPFSASVNAGPIANAVRRDDCIIFPFACKPIIDQCVLERQEPYAFSDTEPNTNLKRLPTTFGPTYGHYSCPVAEVFPLTGRDDKSLLISAIDAYAASGANAGHIGTAWGWYLLSPHWTSVYPPESAPAPYGKSNVVKAMIMITGGAFDTNFNATPLSSDARQIPESFGQFAALCSAIKQSGIDIYTVGLDLPDADAVSRVRNCASDPARFYDTGTASQLNDVIKDIANKLGHIRVAS